MQLRPELASVSAQPPMMFYKRKETKIEVKLVLKSRIIFQAQIIFLIGLYIQYKESKK